MRYRWFSLLIPACAAALLIFAPVPARPQGAAKGAFKAPRTPDGKANLQGIWQAMSTGNAYNLEAHTPMLGIPGGMGAIIDPADGKIPYKPEARAKQEQNFKNRAKADPVGRCFMPGVPRMMTMAFPFQILQTPTLITMLSEFGHATRNVFMGSQHLDGLELWMGDSRGRWEGDTLVVDASQFNGDTWMDAAGNHHSASLHVVERYTLTDPNTLTYEATFEDPNVYTRPWTIRLLFYRHLEPNFRVLEYECNAYEEIESGVFK